ncbi:Fanconi anemia group I protein-like protein, partial [Stegodyphus mimosarum]
MSKFITGICDEDCLSSTQALQFVLKSIQKSIMKFLSDTENDTHLKESVPLISVIKILYSHFTQDFSEDMYRWIKQLCSQQVFQNASLSKTFLSLCLTLGHQDEHFLSLLRDMAFDVHYHLGDTDPDVTVQGTPNYSIIAAEVARTAILNLISNLEQLLDDMEWVLNFMKANVLTPVEFSSIPRKETYNRESIETGVCIRTADIILIFNEIVQTSVPPDHTANSILKLVTKFYKILCSLTKYYLSLNENKISSLPPAFEKVVKLSGTKLTTQVYSFITYIQMISEEDADKKKKTKSKTVTFKAVREVKTIPALVFEIETYEKNLIILSKKFKKNLVSHMKLSTARDFRINAAAITMVPEQDEDAEIVNEESVSDNTTHSEISDHPNPEEMENVDANAVIDQHSPNKSNITNKSKLNTKRKRLGIRGNSKK